MRGVQGQRPNLYDLEVELSALVAPLLVVCGDEDDQCLEPSLYLKRTVPTAGLVVLPRTGHTLNLEEPARYNQIVLEFLTLVDAGAWVPRDPRSVPGRNPLGTRDDN
jgi:pimeloyl-ACP methyl ester carboxylesterase